ncbi:MAG: septum formation protein Maf [Acidobacteria bacterium]|nr:MAG: septum formation protein Maf [Acidobacteriota bacterium]
MPARRLPRDIAPCTPPRRQYRSPASSAGPKHRLSARLGYSILPPYPGEAPHDLVERLAAAKAELVAARAVGPSIVIAADTIVTLEGHIFTKPRSTDDARHMLERLGGRTHAVVTGVALIRLPDGVRRAFVESTLVHFAALPAEEITRYLATGEPHDKAGAYGIQGRAGRYIPRIEGCYFNVVGLPLAHLLSSLTELGWSED